MRIHPDEEKLMVLLHHTRKLLTTIESIPMLPHKLLLVVNQHLHNCAMNSILHSRQHGFRKGLSCETQLCSTYHDVVKLTESSSAVHAGVHDFKNAFDKVPHRRLVDKLKSLPNVDPPHFKLDSRFFDKPKSTSCG